MTSFTPPEPAEALARLGMPMDEAMRTHKLYRRLYRLLNPIVERQARGDAQQQRNIAPGQWQAEHF